MLELRRISCVITKGRKVEITGATQDYETLISRLFQTFLYFETKKQVVPWHQWHHLVRRHCTYYISYQKKWMLRSCCWVSKCSILGPWLQAILQRRRIFPLRRIRATILGPFSFSKQRTLKSKRKHK